MKLKKLISFLLIVAVLFSSLLTVSAAQEHRVTDDFESYSQKANETVNGVKKWAIYKIFIISKPKGLST